MTYLYGIYSIVHNKDIKNFLRDLHYRLNWKVLVNICVGIAL